MLTYALVPNASIKAKGDISNSCFFSGGVQHDRYIENPFHGDVDVKIAYVLNTYPQPSHSFIRREVLALERQGFEISRFAMRRSAAELVDRQDQAEAEKTDYILDRGALGLLFGLVRSALRRPGAFWQGAKTAFRCGRASPTGVLRHVIYLAEAVDVVQRAKSAEIEHLHAHFGTNAATVAMLAHVLGGPEYSFTVHGPEEFDAPAALSLGSKLDKAKFAVGVSQFGRSQLSRWAKFESWEQLQVVHCGIEPHAFAVTQPMSESTLHLVSIGRFVEQKGQMVLIHALARLRNTHPHIHLTLVGDGEMRADLEQAIAKLDISKMVTLTGWLDEAGVRAALGAAHVLVMPSFAEGLPMVVMEAMAAARPVIATYIAGTPELVVDGETGWLVPAGDAQALAIAIERAEHTPRSELDQMGQKGRLRVLERHDIDREATKLATHFRTNINDRLPPSSPV